MKSISVAVSDKFYEFLMKHNKKRGTLHGTDFYIDNVEYRDGQGLLCKAAFKSYFAGSQTYSLATDIIDREDRGESNAIDED